MHVPAGWAPATVLDEHATHGRASPAARALDDVRSRAGVLRLTVFVAGYLFSVQASEHLYGSLAVPSPFWFPDSVLLCALLLTPRERWWMLIAATWPIRLVAGAPAGTPYWFVIGSIANDSVKAFVAAWLLQRIAARPVRLNTFRELLIFMAIATAAVPALSALIAMPMRSALGDAGLWSVGYRWFLGNALAQAVVTPMLLYWCTGRSASLGFRWKELLLLSSGLLAILYYAFVLPHDTYTPSLLYAAVPFLLWAAVRLRPFGTANAIALVAVVAMLSAVNGSGVFAVSSSADNVLSIQLFLLVVAVSLLSLATLVAENASTTEELKAVLDAAPVPILIATDAECRRVVANRIGHRLHRAAIGDVRHLAPAVEEQSEMPIRLLRQVATTGSAVFGEVFTCDREDGVERHWVANLAPLLGEDRAPRGVVGAFLDITDSRLAERRLRESEERFRLVADTAPVLIWMSGADKLHTFFNKGWRDFTGRSLDEELGDGWVSDVHPDDRDLCVEAYAQAFDARKGFAIEYRLRRHDGDYRWIASRAVPRLESDGAFAGYIGSGLDITERKLAETWRQELSGRLIDAQDQERARIARELHDDFGQRMALLQFGIDQLGQDLQGISVDSSRQLQLLVDAAADIASGIQGLSHQLHPATLEVLGVVTAVKGLCRTLSDQLQLNVRFVYRDVPEHIARDVSVSLFRVAQEALRNVVKHSGVVEATVELSGDSEDVELRVSDSGAGFDPDAVLRRGGIGLVSMRERLRHIGGRLMVDSAPGHGTQIHARVPAHGASDRSAEHRHAQATPNARRLTARAMRRRLPAES